MPYHIYTHAHCYGRGKKKYANDARGLKGLATHPKASLVIERNIKTTLSRMLLKSRDFIAKYIDISPCKIARLEAHTCTDARTV